MINSIAKYINIFTAIIIVMLFLYKLYNVFIVQIFVPNSSTSIPFSFAKKGNSLVLDFDVKREDDFAFYIDLNFNRENKEEFNNISRLAGDGFRRPDGTTIDDGLPIPIKLSVTRINPEVKLINRLVPANESIFIEKIINKEEFYGYSVGKIGYFLKHICNIHFYFGKYKIKVEVLDDKPELENIKTNFDINVPGPLHW